MSWFIKQAVALITLVCWSHAVMSNTHDKEFSSKPIKVAVASNFYHTLSQLLATEISLPFDVKVSSGSTGLLFAQIKKGAPFDVFLSADSARPQRLVNDGLALPAKTYAQGKLVLWPVSPSNQVNAATLLKRFNGKLAIANPKLAPYGKAAMEYLDGSNLKNAFQSRLLRANNVNQAFQFVDSGNAEMALLAEAQLILAQSSFKSNASKYQNYLVITPANYQPIKQQLVVIKRTKALTSAQVFVQALISDEIQAKIANMGYEISRD